MTATVTANISAPGSGSNGVLLQSVGAAGAGPLSLTVAPGATISGGSGFAAGVQFAGGGANTLVNRGVVTSSLGVDGVAMLGGAGDDRVDNAGAIYGSIQLGAGANGLHNFPGGTMHSGAWITLGPGGSFLNDGVLSPGGPGRVQQTILNGNFTQSPQGVLAVDLDFANTGQGHEADRLAATGVAVAGGVVQVSVLNKGQARTGDHAVTILSAAGGVNGSGLGLAAPVSAITAFSLRFPDPNTIQLGYRVDFYQPGLNYNQSVVGDTLNPILRNGPPAGMAPVVAALFDIPTVHALGRTYDRLSAEPYLQQIAAAEDASRVFTDRLASCSRRAGDIALRDRDSCGWMEIAGRRSLGP